MSTFPPLNARLGRIGLAFAALISIAAIATPALAAPEESFEQRYHKKYLNDYPNYRNNNSRDNTYRHQQRHRHNDNDGFFSFGFGGGPVAAQERLADIAHRMPDGRVVATNRHLPGVC
jgi:hypothetical protein